MGTQTPPLKPILPAYHLEILPGDQKQALKDTTLQILDQVGVHCPSKRALQIYSENGCAVNWISQIVKIPPDVELRRLHIVGRWRSTLGCKC